MTIQEALRYGFASLEPTNSGSHQIDTELILAKNIFHSKRPRILDFLDYAQSISKNHLTRLHPNYQLTKQQAAIFKQLIAKRFEHVPLAYLTNVKEFFGIPFYVDNRVLIPRPQTEALVEKVINLLTFSPSHLLANPMTIIDVGTGSGCIIISIVKTLQKQSVIARFDEAISSDASRRDRHTSLTLVRDDNVKNITFIATDTGQETLTIAKRNARIHEVSNLVRFIKTNSLPSITTEHLIIIANLPYLKASLKSELIRTTPELQFEPQTALFAPDNGLKHYLKLIQQLKTYQKKHANVTCFFEIDPHQRTLLSTQIARMFKSRVDYRDGVITFKF